MRTSRHASRIVLILACLSNTDLRAESPPTRQKDQAIVADARAALDAGSPQRALTLLNTRGLRIDPAERRSIEGRASLLSGDIVTARRKLRGVLRLRSRHAPDHYWMGRVHQAGGAPALAAKSYRKAWREGMETADLHRHWAEALRDSGRMLGEIRHLEWNPHEGEPPSPGSFIQNGCLIGSVRSRADRLLIAPPDSALFHVHKALRLDPDDARALLLCGESWATAGRPRRAVDLFRRAAKRLEGPPLAECHEAWARASLALGDFDAYLKHMRTHMQLDGGVVESELAACYDHVAREAENRGDLQRQIRYLILAGELKPDVARLLRLADALILAHRTSDAADYLRQALERRPTRQQRRAIQLRLMRTTYLASPQ